MSIAMKNMIDAVLSLNRRPPFARPSAACSLDDFKRQLFEAVKGRPGVGNVATLMESLDDGDVAAAIIGRNRGVNFDTENICSMDYDEINGHQFMVMEAGGDWEYPVTVFLYWTGTALAGYIPVAGNTYNKVTNTAFGSEPESVANLPEDEVVRAAVAAYAGEIGSENLDEGVYGALGLVEFLGADKWKDLFSAFGDDGYPTDSAFNSPVKDAMDVVDPDMSKMLAEFSVAVNA